MSDEKKKFKDTKLGQWLKTKAPAVLDTVGDLLPDSGALGIVKHLIDIDPGMTEADKAEANKLMLEFEKVEMEDRASARNREIEIAKLKKFDFMFNLTGLVGLGVFCFIVYAIIYLQIPKENMEVWIHLIGICEGIVISIFGYYFGSSIKKNVQQ